MYWVWTRVSPCPPQIGRQQGSCHNLPCVASPYSMFLYSPTFTPSIHQCSSPSALLPLFITNTSSQRCHCPRTISTVPRLGASVTATRLGMSCSPTAVRSEEHTSELQSRPHLV